MADEAQWAHWMRQAMVGDTEHYGRLLEDIMPFLRSLATKRCQAMGIAAGEAEDVVQETLIAIHLKRGTWDPQRPLIPWITTILHYKSIDHRRRRARRTMVSLDHIPSLAASGTDSAVVDTIDVRTILSSLSPPHRSIVQYLSIDGFSVREAAAVLNMSEGAVRVSLHRILKGLSSRYALNV